jgi:heme-degrading monooxygenase HmoA
MIARIADMQGLPADLDEDYARKIRERIASLDGFCAGYHLVEPDTGRATSITLWRDADAMAAAGRSIGGDGRITASGPSTVRIAEVVAVF